MLRKMIFFLCMSLALGAGQQVLSQEIGEAAFGVKGGLNISSLGGNASQIGSAKFGFHAGIYFAARVSDRIAFQPELVYSQQGFQVNSALTNAFVVNYNYLNLPLLAKIYVADGTSVQVGPQLGYLLNSGELDAIKKVDVALAMGLGYEVASGLNFSLRYNLGLLNTVVNAPNLSSSSTNRVFQLSIGYTFSN
jgi:hypothetical protein